MSGKGASAPERFIAMVADLAPPYWINMGTMAISTLAGSLLILKAPHAPYLRCFCLS
ncbi:MULTISPECIES: hypothetical protein [Brucella]|uniref:hypothetical protein n=1 Tax=Brucella TaxID=234 RepID=UPI000870BDDA|nr:MULTISPECIES: hypothetical protein [Brucella]SCD24697.1 putative membrane protein [Brucella inopinata]